ncbi:sensor histidine kinase [Arthrobacter mobilis]|uniref:Sensor-like histidine kinase SenX3 n=1 Tax=Arthrobacter mobilis TaxID=2724944 RepID=A0A7X6K2G5_9MICC|nr:sensor histidine kinase [Arthrobacter mobilis]NKX53167.1 sensor histidine kinase [Arthrobacter mobilis]
MEPTGRRPARLGFSARMLLLQLAVVALVVLLSAAVFGWLTYQRLGRNAEDQALAVARTVAASSDVRAEVAALADAGPGRLAGEVLAAGPLQPLAEQVRARTDALFVVITDDAGLRLAHPNPALLGQRVSTDPSEALAGREVTAQEQGTLGHSARAKVPVYAPDSTGRIVGEVSVGFSSEDVLESLGGNILPVAATAAGALGLGALASWLLGRRLKRLTLGLEPEDIAALTQDQEAVLRGVDDGVVGVSADRRITVFNRKAKQLLGLDIAADLVGLPLEQAGLPAAAGALLAEAVPESAPLELVAGQRVLILTARAVQPSRTPGRRGYRPDAGTTIAGAPELGWVIMLRDRTELQSLTRQLDAVGALSTALRAQRHEFANRLHTVSGLLDIGRPGQARDYLAEIMAAGPLKYPVEQAELLRDPYLQAFIGAKAVEAAERGVRLRIGPETSIHGQVSDPQDVTTVIGNLIDNAVRAAVHGSNPDRWVEIELLDEPGQDSGTLHLVVADSGDGIQAGPGDGADEVEQLFSEGFSTAAAVRPDLVTGPGAAGDGAPGGELPDIHGQGFGLPLSRQLARRRGGDVWVADRGRPGGPGAVFCARLPGTVAPPAARAAGGKDSGQGNGQDAGRNGGTKR